MPHVAPPRWLVLISLPALLVLAASAQSLSANSGINGADTYVTFDVAIQTSAAINSSTPIYNTYTGQSSNTLSLAANTTYHVEAGYDPNGQLVLNIFPAGTPPDPGTDASTVSVIRLAGGQVTVFDASGNPIPLVAPAANAPLPASLQYLGTNPGPSVINGMVIPQSSMAAYAAARGGTLSSPPTDCAPPSCGGGSSVIEMTMTPAQGGAVHWWYSASGSNWVASGAEYIPSLPSGTASRVLTFSNVAWSDNAADDQARANRGNTATLPPSPSSSAPSAAVSAPSGSEQIYQDGGPQNIVLQHGLFSSGATWSRMYPWLLDDLRLGTVLIPSLPSTDTLANQTNDLISDINATGEGGYILIGHSQGGLISRAAAQYYSAEHLGSVATGVLTMDTPNQGAPIAVTGPASAAVVINDLAGGLWQFIGCGSPLDNPGCFLAYESAGLGAELGLYNDAPVLNDLQPGSAFLNNLNSASEPFTRAAIVGKSDGRWLEYRLAGDLFCNPDAWCGGRAATTYAEIVHDTFLALGFISYLEGDYPQAEAYTTTALDMDVIDNFWNAIVGSPSDGIVPTSSQAYPASGVPQFVIDHADSHVGATRSDLDRANLVDALINDFNVPPQSGCTFSASPASFNTAVGGGSQSFTLYTQTGCGWSAVSQVPWLTPSADTGTAQSTGVPLSFTAAANPTTLIRTGTVTIGNGRGAAAVLLVTQAGQCDYSVAPLQIYEPSSGGGGYVGVSPTNAECVWSAVPQESWITVSSATGTGGGGFSFDAAPNSNGATLIGAVAVAGQNVSLDIGGTSGASSTATLTIYASGSTSKQIDCPYHCFTVWDNSSISVTVGGITAQVWGYPQTDTAASVAGYLANAFNDYPGSLVTATVSGSKVTITSKLRGSATDYAVSHSYTWNSSYFGDSAFSVVQSSAAMTGGAN